jgi:hypothetical protein
MAKFAQRRDASLRTMHRAIRKLCLAPLRRGVQASGADRYVKRYRSRDFALSLIWYFVLGLHSLRELHVYLQANPMLTELNSLRGISNAQLANLLHDRPPALWEPLLAALLARVGPVRALLPQPVWAMDATFFTLGCRLLARMLGRTLQPENAGVKLSVVLDLGSLALRSFHLSIGSGHDAEHSEQLLLAHRDITGILVVFDRGYRKYQFFRDLIGRGADFLTRAGATDCFRAVASMLLDPAHPEIVCDELGYLGGSRQKPIFLRRIVKRCGDGSELVLLTTVTDLSAADIALTYARRWDIESFFRWLKREVHLQRPLGYRSLQAAEHTILAALVVYLLARLLAETTVDPDTGRVVVHIGPALQYLRARLHAKPTARERRALGFP